VNQSVIDLCASFLALMIALVELDGTGMSRDRVYDQFICRIWLTRVLLWGLMVTSTYGILLTALERYVAVVYPFWYKVVTYICCTAIAARDRPKIDFTFSAENETGAENDSSFSARN